MAAVAEAMAKAMAKEMERKMIAREAEVTRMVAEAAEVRKAIRGARRSAGRLLRWTGGLRPLARGDQPQELVRGFAGIQLPATHLL